MHGGNVVDAAIATSAVLCVTQNNLCGLGGDFFALIKMRRKEVRGLNASGRAGEQATIDFFESNRFNAIPSRGPLSAITVPGIVKAWDDLLSEFGSQDLSELLSASIDYAKNGVSLTARYVDSIRSSMKFLAQYEGWKKLFLRDESSPPPPGSIFKQPDLAKTLETIAQEGAETFYDGYLSEMIIKGIQAEGGVLTAEDFRKHASSWDSPLKTNYRGVDVYETAPNSQGATVLLWLNILEKYKLSKLQGDSEQLIEKVMLPSCLLSYTERGKSIADPNFLPLPSNFVSKDFSDELFSKYLGHQLSLSLMQAGQRREARSEKESQGSDTTYFAVADCEGNCVSAIQSNYMGFGSGLVPRGTGFVLQNRGCYFTLERKHHNSLMPGKRTFHTLCASLGELNGKTLFALGCMGGDIQPQVHVQLMTKILDFKCDVQEAVDSPRWAVPFTIYEKANRVLFEPGCHPTQSRESMLGLSIEKLESYSSLMGHAQAIFFGESGGIYGAADPRGDGSVVGF